MPIINTNYGGGSSLPSLINPAIADDVANGKEFINGDGNVVTGTKESIENLLIERDGESVSLYENAEVTTIGSYAFYGVNSIYQCVFPNVTSIDIYAFRDSSVTSVSIPNCIEIRPNAFANTSSLVIISSSSVSTVDTQCFQASNVKIVKFENADSFGVRCFASTHYLLLDFRGRTKDTIPTIAIQPFASATNYSVVVPDDLYDEWIISTNWSAIASHIYKESEFYD